MANDSNLCEAAKMGEQKSRVSKAEMKSTVQLQKFAIIQVPAG